MANFQVFFRGNCSICSCKFDVSMGIGKLRIAVYCHLEPPLPIMVLSVSLYIGFVIVTVGITLYIHHLP